MLNMLGLLDAQTTTTYLVIYVWLGAYMPPARALIAPNLKSDSFCIMIYIQWNYIYESYTAKVIC